METICEDGQPNNKIMYGPSWTSAPNKAGQPKKNERRKAVLEKADITKVREKPKLMTRFCQVCHESSHMANDCWELEKNEEVCPEEWKSVLETSQDTWDTLNSGGDAPLQEAEEGTADKVKTLD